MYVRYILRKTGLFGKAPGRPMSSGGRPSADMMMLMLYSVMLLASPSASSRQSNLATAIAFNESRMRKIHLLTS